jgi:imidazole glycerol phosphate synthase glutamine amidotransferase subunit
MNISPITLLDYGAGNLPSVERALHRLGAQTERVNSAEGLAQASAIILPGVGHYAALIRALDKNGLRDELIAATARGVPFLGICLGLQALYQTSEEAPDLHGLNILSGSVRALSGSVKLPHMGWNQLQTQSPSRLLEGIPAAAYFYFAHSYAAQSSNSNGDRGSAPEVRATCLYGTEFVAVAEKENIFAVQFHPEKSGDAGQRVLHNFLRVAA